MKGTRPRRQGHRPSSWAQENEWERGHSISDQESVRKEKPQLKSFNGTPRGISKVLTLSTTKPDTSSPGRSHSPRPFQTESQQSGAGHRSPGSSVGAESCPGLQKAFPSCHEAKCRPKVPAALLLGPRAGSRTEFLRLSCGYFREPILYSLGRGIKTYFLRG